jgi:hypothetical protein
MGSSGIGQPGGPDLSRPHSNDPHPQTNMPIGPTKQNLREPYEQPRGGAPR